MNTIVVEPINTKFTAYHFDGTKELAQEFVDKWQCVMSQVNKNWHDSEQQYNENNLYKIVFADSKEVMPGDYIVMENNNKVIYKQNEFISKYKIVYDSRDRMSNFYSID